jgi:hypothetical protein
MSKISHSFKKFDSELKENKAAQSKKHKELEADRNVVFIGHKEYKMISKQLNLIIHLFRL